MQTKPRNSFQFKIRASKYTHDHRNLYSVISRRGENIKSLRSSSAVI